MIEFALHPSIYATGKHQGLRAMLEEMWIRSHHIGSGSIYIIAGFANFNGGARFYKTFKEHTEQGGSITAILGGSASQRTSSRQVVQALLDCGANVYVTNRKSLMHAKCYGVQSEQGQQLVVTSGNFTGPGMAQNVEAAIYLDSKATKDMGFEWQKLMEQVLAEPWANHNPSALSVLHPAWNLLYDETPGLVAIEQSEKNTMIMKLGHADTARIMAAPGTNAAKGSQYFWLSKDCFDFFPPLTLQNQRGYKGTLSTIITIHYKDLGITDTECRVTFEAENNLDFRLGTGALRSTKLAQQGDIVCLSRIGEIEYELFVVSQNTPQYAQLMPFATSFIGHQGKQYGFIENNSLRKIVRAM